ncbi:MAG: polymorphic toxin-type HINT domain-containing protein [Pirellulales bacterium]
MHVFNFGGYVAAFQDRTLSRPEDDPYAEVRESVIEKVFKLSGQTVRLVVGAVAELAKVPRTEALLIDRIDASPGYIVQREWDVSSIAGIAESASSESQTIITTGEHPFYVVGRGWVQAFELSRGDQLETEDGQTVEILSAEATGKLESVYNVRVAHDHTYFVGSPAWGFAIWVHNQYGISVDKKTGAYIPDSDGKYRIRDVEGNVTQKNGAPEELSDLERAKERMNEVNESLYSSGKWKDRTNPSGPLGGKPEGPRTELVGNSENKRGLRRENESADILAKKGYKVEQNPSVPNQITNPDYLIEERYFDSYAPGPNTDVKAIMDTIDEKVAAQAKRIVLNLGDSNVSKHELRAAIEQFPSTYSRDDLAEIILIDKNGVVTRFFP